jgi:HEAT repeat protein
MKDGAELERALASLDPEERRRAVSLIADLPPSSRVRPLLSALGDNDWRVRKEAIGLTAELGPEPDLLTALAKVFEPGDNVGLRNAAVEALGAFGGFAVEALSPVVMSLDADGKKLAIEALGRSGEGAALDLLAPLVTDVDPNVRVAALEAVGAIGASRVGDARALLSTRLDQADPLETLAALEALVTIGAGLPFERVERWLHDPLLEHAALALAAQSGDSRAAGPLLQALLSARGPEAVCALSEYVRTSDAARSSAQTELTQAGEHAERLLLEFLQRRDVEVEAARAALSVVGALGVASGAGLAVTWLADPRCYPEADHALFALGVSAIPALLHGAESDEVETASACLELLGRLPVEAVSSDVRRRLATALGSSSPDVVRSALAALTRVGDADCMSALVGLLADPQVVGSVEPALVAISQRHPLSALELVQLGSTHGPGAHATALIIAALSPSGKLSGLDRAELTTFCMRLLMSTSPEQRRAALLGLGELQSADALDAVRFALADEEQAVRVEAVRALGRLKADDQSSVGVPALLEVVAEARDPVLLLASLRALGESSDPRAQSVLGPLVRSSDARVAVAAVEALSRHADPRRLSALFDGLHHPEPEVVKAAMLAIATEPDPRVIVHLGACLDQSAWDVRRLAADLLGRETSEASAALLRARLGVEQDPMVKDALSRALEAAGQRRSRPPRRPQGEI